MNRTLLSFGMALSAGLGLLSAVPRAHADFSYGFVFGLPPETILNGSAVHTGEIQLTTGGGHAGSMWHDTRQAVSTGFTTTFQFRIGEGPLAIPGDGFAFVLHDAGNATGSLGGGGSDMGYAGIERSIAIEFDTFTFGPPSEFLAPHVSIQTRGSNLNESNDGASLGHVILSDVGVNILDNDYHFATVQYSPPDPGMGTPGVMQVFVDDVLVLSVNLDLENIDGMGDNITAFGEMYVGFTGATGLADSTHSLTAWSFDNSSPCVEPRWHLGGWGGCGIGCFWGAEVHFAGHRPMTFQWYRNGMEITDDDGGRLTGLQTPEITINDLRCTDAGLYSCVATSACGSATSFEAPLEFPLPCDVNDDGGADTADVIDLADAIATGGSLPNACASTDFNQDGGADNSDVIDLADAIAAGTCP